MTEKIIYIRKIITIFAKPFTIAQPYFSALIIGFMGVLSLNYAQSEILRFETFAKNVEISLEPYKKFSLETREFMGLNMIYGKINKEEYNSTIKMNRFSGQVARAERISQSSIDTINSLDEAKKILDEIEKTNPINLSGGSELKNHILNFKKASDQVVFSAIFDLDKQVLRPYIYRYNYFGANNKDGLKYATVNYNDTVLEESRVAILKTDTEINYIIDFLKIKSRDEVYANILKYWLCTLCGLYLVVFIYNKYIKL